MFGGCSKRLVTKVHLSPFIKFVYLFFFEVVIDRRTDVKADVGNFELIYRQVIPPTPAYMGLNLIVKGKQISNRLSSHHNSYQNYQRREKSLQTSQLYKQRTSLAITNVSQVHKPMPAFNATDYIEKYLVVENSNSPRCKSVPCLIDVCGRKTNLISQTNVPYKHRKSLTNLMAATTVKAHLKPTSPKSNLSTISSLKRHRSCGPTLSANSVVDLKNSQKSKFFIAAYNQQKALYSSRNTKRLKSTLLDAPGLTISKSADNIKELCSPANNTIKFAKSLSPMTSGKIAISNNMKSQSNLCVQSKENKNDFNDIKIHAIGRSITAWNNTYKNKQICKS